MHLILCYYSTQFATGWVYVAPGQIHVATGWLPFVPGQVPTSLH